jgi:inositol-phosphate transport system substrate-binding protein
MSKKLGVLALFIVGSMLLTACGAAATPETIVETVIETVEVTRVVEVEKEVQVEVPVGGDLVSIVARCKAAPPHELGRCNNLVSAVGAANQALAEMGDSRRIDLEIIQDNADWGDYKTEFELASDAGQAPDIVCSGHEHIGDWAPAGYLVDITAMLGDYPEFDDVIDALWASTEFQGSRWGADIDSLSDRIMSGQFTWEDMFDTAEEAVEAGVVAEGNGWWHRPKNGGDFLYYYYAAGGEIVGTGDALVFDKDAALKVYEKLYEATQERGILSDTRLDGDWTTWHTGVTGSDVLFSSAVRGTGPSGSATMLSTLAERTICGRTLALLPFRVWRTAPAIPPP